MFRHVQDQRRGNVTKSSTFAATHAWFLQPIGWIRSRQRARRYFGRARRYPPTTGVVAAGAASSPPLRLRRIGRLKVKNGVFTAHIRHIDPAPNRPTEQAVNL